MAILCVKLKPIVRPADLNNPCHDYEWFAELGVLFNVNQRLFHSQSPEVSTFIGPEKHHIDEETVYYVYGIEPTDMEVKIQTLLEIGRNAASVEGVECAIAFTHPDDIRGSDLKGMGSFASIMDILDNETELFKG